MICLGSVVCVSLMVYLRYVRPQIEYIGNIETWTNPPAKDQREIRNERCIIFFCFCLCIHLL